MLLGWRQVVCPGCKISVMQLDDEMGLDPEVCPGCNQSLPELCSAAKSGAMSKVSDGEADLPEQWIAEGYNCKLCGSAILCQDACSDDSDIQWFCNNLFCRKAWSGDKTSDTEKPDWVIKS